MLCVQDRFFWGGSISNYLSFCMHGTPTMYLCHANNEIMYLWTHLFVNLPSTAYYEHTMQADAHMRSSMI